MGVDQYHPAVDQPDRSRPHMPGYGMLSAQHGRGLLAWSWAQERLVRSHDYWLATVTPTEAPHLMPVWAVWHEDRLWFSSANGSRKARNLAREPRCSLATADPLEPVVVHGRVRRVVDPAELERMLTAENVKYGTDYGLEMVDSSGQLRLRADTRVGVRLGLPRLHWITDAVRLPSRQRLSVEGCAKGSACVDDSGLRPVMAQAQTMRRKPVRLLTHSSRRCGNQLARGERAPSRRLR
jgi:hypothetical protein